MNPNPSPICGWNKIPDHILNYPLYSWLTDWRVEIATDRLINRQIDILMDR